MKPLNRIRLKNLLATLLRLTIAFAVAIVFTFLGLLGEVRTAIAQTSISEQNLVEAQNLAEGLPDYDSFGTQTFGDIRFNREGSIDGVPADVAKQMGYDTGRIWAAGARAADVLKLGDLSGSFYPQQLTISDVERRTGIDTTGLSISEYQGLLQGQSVGSLSSLLGLENFRLDEVAPLQDVFNEAVRPQLEVEAAGQLNQIAQSLGVPADAVPVEAFDPVNFIEAELLEYGQQTVGELIATPDLLEGATFGDISIGDSLDILGSYRVEDLPGLENLPLQELDGWQDAVLSEVPGLDSIPFGDFPNPIAAITGGFGGIHDVTYGEKESRVTPTRFSISGSDQAGFRVECAQERGCAYLELQGSGEMAGARWIAGGSGAGQQMVEGGSGLLKMINGGMEPTGRHPFGDVFKIVLTDTTESEGTGDFALYTRFCQRSFFVDLGCTPYFIGPIPVWFTQEEGFVLTGPLDGQGGASGGLEVPPELQQYQSRNLGGSYYGSGRNSQVQMDEECLEGLLSVTPSVQQSGAAENIPIIVEAANKYGLDRAQIAYVLATVRRETGGVGWAPVEEIGRPCDYSGGCGWHGRGYVQLTHDYNYARVRDELGIDVVSDPSLALQPDVAAEILIQGMMKGWFNGTGRGLASYVSDERQDFFNARRTVNVLDRAGEIAGHAEQYYRALQQCRTLETSRGSVGAPVEPLKTFRTGTLAAQEYGAPRDGGARRHAGQDLDITQGIDDEAQSYIGGVVTRVGNDPGGYGNYVDIYNAELGVVERVAEGVQLTVGLGDTVAPGQVVSTGESNTGVIHIEYRDPVNAQNQGGFGFGGTYDPVEFLESKGIVERRGNQLVPLINE